jgi:hypothetical protein
MRRIKYPFYIQKYKIDIEKFDKFCDEYLKLFDVKFKDKIDEILRKIDSNFNHQKLFCFTFSELLEFVKKINKDCNNMKDLNQLFRTNKGFKYDNKRKDLLNFMINQKIKINSCHYCNIDFINSFVDDKNYDNSTFDHVLPKEIFPFLSLSIFNIVPCCSPCNSKFKHTTEFIIDEHLPKLIPSSKEYILDELVQFQLKFKENKKDKLDLKVDLTNLSNIDNIDEFITMFKLKGRYEFHRQKAIDLVDKRKIYSDSQIREIAKLLARDELSIKEDIFGKECFQSNNEPFEKYKQDIAQQLNL